MSELPENERRVRQASEANDASPPADEAPDTDVGETMARASVTVAAAAALFTVVAFFLAGAHDAISVAIGGALVALDTWALGRIVRALLADDPGTNRGLWGLLGLTKLVILFGGVWLLLSHGMVSALGIAAGIASLPAGLVMFTLSSGGHSTAQKKRAR